MTGPLIARRDFADRWDQENPILAEFEAGLVMQRHDFATRIVGVKVGDGATRWKDLSLFAPTWTTGLPFRPESHLRLEVKIGTPMVVLSWGGTTDDVTFLSDDRDADIPNVGLLSRRLMIARLRYWADVLEYDTDNPSIKLPDQS